MLTQLFGCTELPVELTGEIYAAGVNPALRRIAQVDIHEPRMLKNVGLSPHWKPTKPKVCTFGLVFPDGLEFLPQPEPAAADGAELTPLEPPRRPEIPEGADEPRKKTTRLEPPDDALRWKTVCSTCCSRRWKPGLPARN